MNPPPFICDTMLGTLARDLRALGVDCAYPAERGDDALVRQAAREGRVLLTRDTELSRRGSVACVLVSSTDPDEQLIEVLRVFHDLTRGEWFSRCLVCNEPTTDVSEDDVRDELPPFVAANHDRFRRCAKCGKLFWSGSHVEHLRARLVRLTAQVSG